MGLRNVVQKAATTAFKAIGDIAVTSTYSSKGVSVYDPSTGLTTSTDTDYTGLKILFEDYTAKEINEAGGVILSTDIKGSIPNLSLDVEPKITDYITDSDSQKWTVQNFDTDAAKALFIFQCRKSG